MFTYVKLSCYSQIDGRFGSATRGQNISCLHSPGFSGSEALRLTPGFPRNTHMAAGYIPRQVQWLEHAANLLLMATRHPARKPVEVSSLSHFRV